MIDGHTVFFHPLSHFTREHLHTKSDSTRLAPDRVSLSLAAGFVAPLSMTRSAVDADTGTKVMRFEWEATPVSSESAESQWEERMPDVAGLSATGWRPIWPCSTTCSVHSRLRRRGSDTSHFYKAPRPMESTSVPFLSQPANAGHATHMARSFHEQTSTLKGERLMAWDCGNTLAE